MRWILPILGIVLSGCVEVATTSSNAPDTSLDHSLGQLDARTSAKNFVTVVHRVEHVAEQECRNRTRKVNCDFQIMVDQKQGEPPNASQSLDARGRPVITFTVALIAEARNQDELAFILGHESAHHIAGHIPKAQQTAQAGAAIGTLIASALGAGDATIQTAQQIGASVGVRGYSKGFELEADELGTIIAAKAGYDPVRGAQYFSRIPDPGDRFLGSHPPNSQRIEMVRQTAASLR